MSEETCASLSGRDVAAWRRHLDAEEFAPAQLASALAAGSLPGAALDTARSHPDRPALLFPHDSDRWITHGELAERVARTGAWLAERGLRNGARVLVCGHNTASLVIAYLAVLRCGGVVVLANPAYTAAELGHLVTDSQAEWALATRTALDALESAPQLHTVCLDEPLPQSEPAAAAEPHSQDTALLAYTSGTTGAPKGVPLTHGNLLSSIRAAMWAWEWSERDVLVHSLPLSHQHGLGGVHATLLAGSCAVILAKFDPPALAEALGTYGASVLFAVPAIYDRLVSEPGFAAANLRLAVSGSAPLDPELAGAIAGITGVPPLERYGSTESGLDVSNPLSGPRLPGTVGLPLPGVELRIADDSGEQLPAGTDGEILLRGPQVFGGYWNRPQDTAEVFHPGGWFRTGDIGRIDSDTGYLSITGRKKELIITGGMNVYPREVELALERHPAIVEAAVGGLPSQRWGEQVTAWVVPNGRVDPAEVIEHTGGLLAAYKRPKQVITVDSLPRNGMGKLQRAALVAEESGLDTSELDRAVAKLHRADLS